MVLDDLVWIASTGVPWRGLPEEFGKWCSVYRQFSRWSVVGVRGAMLEALNAAGMAPSSVQMIYHHPRPPARIGRKEGDRQVSTLPIHQSTLRCLTYLAPYWLLS
ncbi:hypothetical protein DK847_19330 [Aestuariivirga litoralis]|uniref:Insertion element IS402-like domain-containing protein n=1 Tax=Aestuariivirga litoralis TaxID=2650924 RepID=A0A2W2BH67_9HYPH|nr:hypothetical protein DK847_19330 [Aestuariivirga litoralis]